jgi:hypothetical protein
MPQASAVEINSPQPLQAPPIAVDPLTIAATTLNGSVSSGATSITLTASISGLGLGSPLTITDGASTEVVTVLSIASAPTYTLAAPTLYAHASAIPVSLIVYAQAISLMDPANPTRRSTLDPNNNLLISPGPNPNLVTGTLSAAWNGTGVAPANSQVQLTLAGANYATCVIPTGTASLIVIPEMSLDGLSWITCNYQVLTSNVAPANATYTYNGTAVGIYIFAPSALYVRLRCSTFTSGSAAVTFSADTFSSAPPIYTIPTITTVGTVSAVSNAVIGATSGAFYTIASNSTLAALTNSTAVSMGFSTVSTLFFLATCATAGVVTIALSAEGTYWVNWIVTITLPVGTTGIVLTLPPLRNVRLQSTVALTAFTASVTVKF